MDASTATSGDANNNLCYDVFISHRGPDVKKTFASHLYRRLSCHKLRVFLDYEELQAGEILNPQIERAIASASVHVAIFSPDYAGSKWCLDELVLMRESKAPIIPVFHRVEPAELRRTYKEDQGVYARGLCSLEKKRTYDDQPRYNSTTIEKWRDALSSVSKTSGLELKACNGDEGELLDKVTECVCRKVKKTQLNVAKHPTGLDEKAQDFEDKVLSKQHSGRIQVVGITGMVGVGKTTLAKELFNRKSSTSNYINKSYFLFNVRENTIKSSLHYLQRELLKGLIQLDLPIDSMDQGIEMLKKHPEKMRVLIVLDDVDSVDQVDKLLPMKDVLQPDSLILITSRDKNVLARSGVQESSIYQLTGLDEPDSIKLFCSYAFHQPHPLAGFDSLVHQFLKVCNGLPLSLKVHGELVYGKNEQDWKLQLKRLQRILPKDIQNSLRISYDALEDDQKQVFLDIACFFIGEEKDIAIKIWGGSDWSGSLGFQTLQDKCLVEVDIGNTIKMHGHLRDLGRELAKLPEFPRRLWRGIEDIDDLRPHSFGPGITEVRGIRWRDQSFTNKDEEEGCLKDQDEEDDSEEEDGDEHDDADSSYPGGKLLQLIKEVKITKLHLLDVDNLSENFMRGVYNPKLVWLRWYNCHLPSLPRWIPMQNLKVLEVQGNELKTLWEDKSKVPSQLKQLERIEVSCEYIEELPKDFDRLQSLKALVLRGCSKLRSLPDSFGKLTNLEHINLLDCTNLKRLPNSFRDLSRLRTVNVTDCSELEELLNFEKLRSLEELHVHRCWKLRSIRGSAELKIRTINVSDCPALEELTKLRTGYENSRSFEELHVSGCGKSIPGWHN